MAQTYGYARVSSTGQGLYGTSLDNQVEQLKEVGAKLIFKDVYTGTSESRPQLDALLKIIESGDTLVVTKLDRLGRKTQVILELVEKLTNRGITVNVLNMGVFNKTPMGQLMLTMLAGIAQFERDMIVERCQAGLQRKYETDPTFRTGPRGSRLDRDKLNKLYPFIESYELSISDAAKLLGVSYQVVYHQAILRGWMPQDQFEYQEYCKKREEEQIAEESASA